MSYLMDAPLRDSRSLLAPSAAIADGVVSMTLINADTGAAIPGFDPLPVGQTITLNLATLPTRRLSIRANTSGSVGSVRFGYDGNAAYSVEKIAPYALNGDTTETGYSPWMPTLGTHAVTATAFSAIDATVPLGASQTVSFIVIDQASTPTTPSAILPAADAYVRDGDSRNINFGSGAELQVKKATSSNREAILQFNVPAGDAVTEATLRLYGKLLDDRASNVPTDVYGVSAAWSESSVTWDTRPDASTPMQGTIIVKNSQAAWYELDITQLVSATQSANKTSVSILLRNSISTSPYTIFSSREAGANQPQLILDRSASPPPLTQTPYSGTPISLPGLIQAENFDNGGEGVAFHDADLANRDGTYRDTAVDTGTGIGSDGGYVGHTTPGEWLEYTVNVPTAGAYQLDVRAAAAKAGGKFHIEVDGTDKTGAIVMSNTGGYDRWQIFSKSGINMTAGSHVVRLSFDFTVGGGIANLDWLRFSQSEPTPTAWPTTWTSAKASPVARFESTTHVFSGKVYVFGGYIDSSFHVTKRVDTYDPVANAWTRKGDLPATMAETHLGVTDDGRYMYFAGGNIGDLIATRSPSQPASDRVWRYDPQNDTWLEMTKLPFARGAGGLAVIGRTLHYIGGNPNDRVTDLADHITFNLDGGSGTQWITSAPMLNPRDHFSTVVMGGKIYTIGGVHGHDLLDDRQKETDVYDPQTNTWTKLADMPMAKSHMEGGTFVLNGQIIFAGGQTVNPNSTDNVVSYDPVSNTWKTLSPLPQPRQGAVAALIGNQIIITLGGVVTYWPQSETWIGMLA